ncbi:protein of unknown function [Pseudobutyrivibrio sp. ACV-2]|uniref:DUF4190 domain-containing protein n=1 Tax=Pseudobutyrivibrio sp. ACV-2 TaxID=1520801 RepID=UPI000898B37F|nr:DUF4190 domain-containing protein [Pseudobutyrivibrio sp. ACV-2]SEA30894.1 protein of unknown function [Pseudobutyrivibrio sp. ACV-2]
MNEEYYFTEDIDKELRRPQMNENARPENYGLAIASMILGIFSLVFFLFGINFLTAIAGTILGIIFLVTSMQTHSSKGRGMAITGIITSVLSIALFIGSIAYIMHNSDNIVRMFESEFLFNPGIQDEFNFEYNFDYDIDDNDLDFDTDTDNTL